MNVYDFDKTIYNGDSTADFITFCLKEYPHLSIKMLKGGIYFCLYSAKLYSKTEFKEKLFSFFSAIDNIDDVVKAFWLTNRFKIKKWYLEQKKDDDIIISASPRFLLEPICKILNITNLIASEVDKTTGFYNGINCFGAEKVRRFYLEGFSDIDEFYSDSYSDEPLAKLAKEAFIVDKNTITPWDFH